jgi:mRNA interferase RelE/StbE
MPHRIEFTPAAAREFRKLATELQKRIGRRIDKLATDPRPDGVKKLSDGSYRIRIGDYRVLYQIQDTQLLIVVIRVRNRKDAYGA